MSTQRFLDTNVLIHFFTQDDTEKHRHSSAFMQRLADGDETVTTNLVVIFECVFILEKTYRMPRMNVRSALETLLSLRSVRIADRELIINALAQYEELNVSFADAYNAVFLRERDIREIYTWDKDFDRIPWVRRVDPG